MTNKVPCPRCERLVDSQARYCENCGVDLAIAAVLAERTVATAIEPIPNAPLTPEVLVPRLGSYLMEKGVLDASGLEQALAYQENMAQAGKQILLGQALHALDLVDAETIDQAITMQILQLHTALQQANRQLEARVKERTVELEKAVEKLKELNQLKANFIATISHELRTPLAHLKGYLDLVYDGSLGSLTPEQENALSVMARAEARLESLIEDLIQFGLAARGELNLAVEEIEIGTLIQLLVEQASKKAAAKKIVIEMNIPENLSRVLCDGEKIGWVVAQLLDNAIKFTPPEGSVLVEVSQQDSGVDISVIDSGIGIPADRFDEIYEPFHQLDSSSTRRYGGTGIGLALSSRILAAHNTEFVVKSQLGVGSQFSFSLPVAMRILQSEKV